MEKSEDINLIKKKTIISSMSLFFQSGYSAGLGFLANLVLTILLTPQIFGIYFTVLSLIAILNYFSDIGLAASLIQKKEIDNKDVSTVFTIQQILILGIIFAGWMATPLIMKFYNLPIEGQNLYWALLLSFFLSSLKTIPSVLLERRIKFQKIVFVQIIENTFFYASVIFFALMGFGLNSFAIAVVLRATVGVLLIYIVSPWKITIGVDITVLKQLLSFGVPFQLSSFLALVKDDLLTLYLGKVLGFEILGFLGWAKKWAESPIRIIMDSLSRVLFPLFARFQTDLEKLKKVVEKSIYYQSAIIIPAIAGLSLIMPKLVYFIPKYVKWAPALPYFYLFCISALLSSYSTPFINLFNGLGKAKTSFTFMVIWTAATWVLTPILTHLYGPYGFPITLIILSSSFIIVIFFAKKLVNFSFTKNVFGFFVSSIIMVAGILFLNKLPVPSGPSLILAILGGIITYLFTLRLIFKIDLIDDLWKIFPR